MKKRKPGIFNPYVEEKPEEKPEEKVDTIHLTGDPYTITVAETSLKTVPDDLAFLLQALIKDPQTKSFLENCGVKLLPREKEYARPPEEATLVTVHGRICVHTGEQPSEKLEDEVFRRIGHALHSLNQPGLFKRHKITITKRG